MVFTKTIQINADANLGGPAGLAEIYIVMGFNQDAIKTAKTPFSSTAWRVIPFLTNQAESQTGSGVYTADIGVCKAQITTANIVQPELNKHIDLAKQTDLVMSGDTPSFTPLSPYPTKDGFAVNNQIPEIVTIGAGLYNAANKFDVIAAWPAVWNTSTVDIEFTPIISIFASAEYVKSQLLPGHINSLLWNHNLADPSLPDPITFDLSWDDAAQKYDLTQTN